MSQRGTKLLQTANGQISEAISLLSESGESALIVPNPAREKLGDGTVGASALHTADGYHRIAEIIRASCPGLGQRGVLEHGHAGRDHGNADYSVETVDLRGLLDRLSAGRSALSLLADLDDAQLDHVPRAGSARFCDGKRTLEQLVRVALNHQRRNLDALRAAVS
jgi:hypothetical protein